MMVGYHSTVELAAAAFINSITGGPVVMVIGYSTHIGVLVAQSLGREHGRLAGRILRHGLISNFIISLILVAGLEIINSHLYWFHQTSEVENTAHGFLSCMTISVVPLALFNALRQYADGLQVTLPSMLVIIGSVIVNTICNYFLIFGHGGAPELGLVGAGIGTLIARTLMFIAMALYVVRARRFRNYRDGLFGKKIEWHYLFSGFKIGAPSALQNLFEAGIFFFVAFMMGWIGTEPLAANQTVMSLVAVLYMLPLGLSIATSVRVGEATGRGDPMSARRIGFAALATSLVATSLCAVFLVLCRNLLPRLFTNDLNVIAIAQGLYVIAGFFQIFDGTQAVLVGALRGMSDVKVPTLVMFIAYWALGAPLAYFAGFTLKFGHIGVWVGLALSVVANAIGLTFRFDRISSHRIRVPKP